MKLFNFGRAAIPGPDEGGIDSGMSDSIEDGVKILGEDDGKSDGEEEDSESEDSGESEDTNESDEESGEEGEDSGDASDKSRRRKEGDSTGDDEDGQEEEGEGDDELDKDKKKDDEEDKDDLDIEDPRGKLVRDRLLKVDKDIFKKVPELKAIIFRDNDMGKIFPTIHDAKTAKERLQVFDKVEDSLANGESALILNSLARQNPKILEKFALEFLPTLQSGPNQELYIKATVPIVRNILADAFREAKGTKNQNLHNAALVLTNHIFGSDKLPDLDKIGEDPLSPEREQLNRERMQLHNEKIVGYLSSVKETGIETLWNDVSKYVKAQRLNPLVEKTVIEAVMTDVMKDVDGDRDYKNVMKTLWSQVGLGRVGQENLSPELKSKLIEAFLRRARVNLTTIRDRRLREVLGKDFKPRRFLKPGESENREQRGGTLNKSVHAQSRNKTSTTPNKARTASTDKVNPRDIDYSRTSDDDIFEGKVRLKG